MRRIADGYCLQSFIFSKEILAGATHCFKRLSVSDEHHLC